MPVRITMPDGSDSAIDTTAVADGVELAIAFTLQGQPITALFVMDGPDARTLADGLRAAAGDGRMRTTRIRGSRRSPMADSTFAREGFTVADCTACAKGNLFGGKVQS